MNTLPASLETERAALAAAMKDPQALLAVMGGLARSDFYFEPHRRIFDAIREVWGIGAVDLSGVASELRKREELESVGGEAGLLDVYRSIPTTAHVEYHVGELQALSARRAGIAACGDLMARLYDNTEKAGAPLRDGIGMFGGILERGKPKGAFRPVNDLAGDWYAQVLERRAMAVADLPLVTLGIPSVDRCRLWEPGEVLVVAARPSVGKSMFGVSVAVHNAVERNRGVAIVTLEMESRRIINRMVANLGKVNQNRIYARDVSDEESRAVTAGLGRLSGAPLWLSHCGGAIAVELGARVSLLKLQHPGLRLVVVDYLQLLDSGSNARMVERITEVSGTLKRVAIDAEVVMLVLSQLSRASEHERRYPMLSDLRESGAIEQDADGVCMLARPRDEDEQEMAEPQLEKLVSLWEKDRNGFMAGTKLPLMLDKFTCQMHELTNTPALPPGQWTIAGNQRREKSNEDSSHGRFGLPRANALRSITGGGA